MDSKVCGIEGCESPGRELRNGRRVCSTHARRIDRAGDPSLVRTPARGPQNGRWSETPGIRAVHSRLTRQRGDARWWPCSVEGCSEQAAEWALTLPYDDPRIVLGGRTGRARYSHDTGDYQPMCGRCHREHDRLERQKVAAEHRVLLDR